MGNDYSFLNYSHQWVYSYAMKDNWKKLQSDPTEKKVNHLKKVINDPDGYNTNLASKDRVEKLEEQIDELSNHSSPFAYKEFSEKLTLLHNKIDSIYSIMKVLSDRINTLDYSGEVNFGDLYHATHSTKHVSVRLHRKEEELNTSPNPHGDDDFATPNDD